MWFQQGIKIYYFITGIYHFQQANNLFPYFWMMVIISIGIVENRSILRGWENPKDTVGKKFAGLKDDYIPGDLGNSSYISLKSI